MRRSVSRRVVLTGAAVAATSLLIPIAVTRTRATERQGATGYEITDWITIAASGQVTLGLSQPEVGQGSYTALPQILADELDANWERVEIRFVTGRPAYKIAFRQEVPVQKEGASMSTTVLYERLRTAGAAAREVLTRAAAQTWGLDVSACRTENGFVINDRGERLSYGQLAPDAARLPLSAAPPLKDRSRFHLIGKPVARLDTPAKCNGSAVYGIDVNVPGMLNAAIMTAPSFTGQVVAIKNESDILKMPGVHAVVRIPAVDYRDGSSPSSDASGTTRYNAVCVVADHFWQARRALVSLDVAFDGGAHGDLSSEKIDAALDAALNAEHGVTALVRGQPREILKDHAAAIIERRFKLPHIAHAPHEPCNATASYNNGAVEIWGPIQSVSACQDAVAECFRMPCRQGRDPRHVPRRQLRPQDCSRLRGAGGSRLQGGRTSGQTHSLARRGHAARCLPAERRRARARGAGSGRLPTRGPRPRGRSVAVQCNPQELARPHARRRLGREHGRRPVQSELSAAALPGRDRRHAAAGPGLFHAISGFDGGGILLGEPCHRARP